MKQMIFKTASVLAILTVSSSVFAATKAGARAVGAGLTYPAYHQAIDVNSSTLSEAPKMSLQGLWDFDSQEAAAGLVGSQGKFGWGINWRDQGITNDYGAGIGFNLGGLLVGANLYTTDFEGVNGDVTATIDFSTFRITGALRGVDNGIDRLDVGVGFMLSELLVSLDVRKYLPLSSGNNFMYDASVAYNSGRAGFGLGYAFVTAGGGSGDIHADLSLALTNRLAIEGHYNLTPGYASGISNWSAGARLMF